MTAGAIAVPTIVPLRAPMPGQHKTCIDTNTKIELHSDTPGVVIYYTTNGAKPEPFGSHGPAAKSTYKYKEPFRLGGGRRTVKAVAISQDGLRESHKVTKVFDVEEVQPDHPPIREDGLEFVNDLPHDSRAKKEVAKFAHKMVTSKEAYREISRMKQTEQMMDDMTLMGSSKYQPGMTNGHLGSKGMMGTHAIHGSTDGFGMPQKRLPPDNATQAMRLQRETDFLKCVYCMAPRPSDPYARFCNECGNPVPALPQTRIPPPEPGQMGTCVECNSIVPFNAPTCVICEAPLGPQNTPQASVRLGEKLVCRVCGTANPNTLSSCVTCEAKLPIIGTPLHMVKMVQPPAQPDDKGRMLTCSKCGRVNAGDARFCDWCGSKPSAPGTKLTCEACHASNHPYAQFCGSCGVVVVPPQRSEVRGSGVTVTLQPEGAKRSGNSNWVPVTSGRSMGSQSIATQTVGLFYPSEREMKKRMTEEEEKLAIEKQMRDRKPLLTAVSPGRGYWRKQMEHMVTHLKAHAQNNAEFRALIAEPRMGKIVSTAVHEDGYELSLTVNFALRESKDPFENGHLGSTRRDYLSSYTQGRKSSIDRYNSMDSLMSTESGRKIKKKTTKKVKKVKKKEEEKISPEDKQLLKELGKNGDGRASEIQQLIDEGADPCCVDKDGYPALHVATMNQHIDAIPVLIQEGADVNRKGPTKGNAALHEAVSLGHSGLEVIDVLIGCSANSQKKNDKGETPYDLAVKSGDEAIGRKLAASFGQTALDKLIKPKSSSKPDFMQY